MNNNNNNEIKTVVKVIFAWEDEKEEKWLEQMAADGWRLISVAPYVYKFQRSNPERVVFRLDYKYTLDKDYQEYLTLFRDAGWELFATFANWQYFKINPENSEVPEIYNSDKAKAEKYRRLLFGLIPMMPIYLLLFNPALGFFDAEKGSSLPGFIIGIKVFLVLAFLFMIFAVFKIWMKIKKLQSEHKE